MILHGNGPLIETAEFIAPVINHLEEELPVEESAESLGLSPDAVVTEHHAPHVVSSALRFLYVELRDLETLQT